jgi:16S rRNA (guanine527-N7)-methyltransferase
VTPEAIAALLQPYTSGPLPSALYTQLASYLELILKWNAKTNLTAIREPEEIVRRHFGESLFAAQHLGPSETLLDYGSGAGFPGIPIQLLHPNLAVTLAESQSKKSSFLREAVRTLNLSTEVFAARVETMPPARRFHIVALRAVDNMDTAVAEAASRASSQLLILTTGTAAYPTLAPDFGLTQSHSIPESANSALQIHTRLLAGA